MKGLNYVLMKKLQNGAFVAIFIWTDMFIESTYIRLGHCPAGAAKA